MNNKIKILDCTLRDGAYIVDAKFGVPAIRGIINKMQDANIDIIECGWLKNQEHEIGTTFYHKPSDLKQYLNHKSKYVTYVVMIDWDRYDLKYLPERDGETIDAIRVVFPHGKCKEAMEIANQIKQKGYDVYFQAANTLAYSEADLIELANEVNKLNPVALSVVDTFGAMYEEDLERIINVLDRNMNSNIKLGFHSHNNQQLSFALTMHFVKLLEKSERSIIVDSSLCGMGRGAGNTTTELIANYLNTKKSCDYDINVIMDAIDLYMKHFSENYTWGYSTPYYISGMYCAHVNNIAYLLENHRTSFKEMHNIIEMLPKEERLKYDYDLLEKTYLEYHNKEIDDSSSIETLKTAFQNQNILILAPGGSLNREKEKIKKYIKDNQPIVIGVNSLYEDYECDYVFFSNPQRYKYAWDVHTDKLKKTKCILLSNITTEETDLSKVINFNTLVKRGWEHFDNAVIMCLRLMAKLRVTDVTLAGFDGFSDDYAQSYYDASLPSLNPKNNWNELNEEIKDMFQDFLVSHEDRLNIKFLTETKYK